VACAAGWLSFSSYGLAIVLAVRAVTGSFQLAGAASALFAAGSASLAPARGRTVDRLGWPALAGLAGLHTGAMAVLAAAGMLGGAPWPLPAAAALRAGGRRHAGRGALAAAGRRSATCWRPPACWAGRPGRCRPPQR